MFIDEKKIIEGNESEDVAHLVHVDDSVTDAILCEILRDNDIPFMKKERSGGLVTNVIMGFNVFGSDIYVARDRLDEARELYEAYMSGNAEFDENTENE